MRPPTVSIQDFYAGTKQSYDEFLAALDESLDPRPPDVMYDKFGDLGPSPHSMVLDAGCRHAVQACELSRRFGCRVLGVDLVADNLSEARRHIAEAGMSRSVLVSQGDIHELPFASATFDYIWCRDVLAHMRDLATAFRSFARVLKPKGKMLVYAMFGTDLLTDEEADSLWPPTATVPDNVSRPYFEQAFTSAGLTAIDSDEVGSEWREHGEEAGLKRTSQQLLRIARMRRSRDRLVAAFGETDYVAELANCHWGVYQMLGKLSPVMYTLARLER